MMRNLRAVAAAGVLLISMTGGGTASAQKRGGILRMYSIDSPASMSILEESTVFAEGPMTGLFNNLIIFDQHVRQNSLESIVPDLATSWSWNEEGTELSLPLRQGVKWHDGKPFTAQDVKCTWDLLMVQPARSSGSIPAKPDAPDGRAGEEIGGCAVTRSDFNF
jgi:peptide/nickel transport system substrate-binding protein